MKVHRVLLLIESSRRSGRQLIRGIMNYANMHGVWRFYREPPFYHQHRNDSIMEYIQRIKPHGIISRDSEKSKLLLDLKIPTLLSASYKKARPCEHVITCDHFEVCKMAVDHFLERGYRSFAFCGYGNYCWSREREQHFRELLQEKGFQLRTFNIRPSTRSARANVEKKLLNWLISLPKPIAMLACNDECASEIIDACHVGEIDVPDEISLVGVDNDELICELSSPKISSVSLNDEQNGYYAAERLYKMMSGEKVSSDPIIGGPLNLIVRESSDILAISDQQVAKAVQFIRQNNHRLLQVENVLECKEITVSRRALERRFRESLGHSIYKEIVKNRVSQVCRMLVSTNSSITEIARKLGYSNIDHVSRWFRGETGMSLREFRKKCGHEKYG